MKKSTLLLALALAASLVSHVSAQTFAGADNFDSGSAAAWSYSGRFPGAAGNGLLSFSNQRLDFTKANPGAGSFFRGWDGDGAGTNHITPSSYSTSWVANLQVTNALSSLAGSEFATVGFQVTDSLGNYSALMLNSTSSGHAFQLEGTGFSTQLAAASSDTDVFLRMAWDAGTQTLNSYYSVDGSTYTSFSSFNPVSPWAGGNLSNGFWFEVFANSNTPGAILAGSVYADNFAISAVPEPSTYAAFAGLGALGLAIWRRRQSRVGAQA